MRTNMKATLWHLEEDGNYTRWTAPCRIFMELKISKSGIKQMGYFCGNRAVLRIPFCGEIMPAPGDYLRVGEHSDDIPDRINDFKVMQINMNLWGSNPHMRVYAGRSSERS